ncbi:condensation domain-containing protein [Streptomyces sp. NPDC020983]|uniref:condensation domain-containing protein n=1 Tax=Streptomyces sp. NPDC020983 TaxID=3365106 RepID=UPI0037B8EFD4
MTEAPPAPAAGRPAPPRVVWEPVAFSAEGGEGPLAWGQFHMWRPLLRYGAAFATFTLRQVVALPAPGPGVPEALAAIRRLVETHQVLRTRFRDRAGEAWQTAAAEGTHLVEVCELGADAGAGALAAFAERRTRKLAAEPFRHSHEWPVRFSLVCRGGEVRAVAVVCSHLTFDGWSADLVGTALRRLLAGGRVTAPEWQPLDQAAYERSERGLRDDARAMRHFRARLAEVPDTAPRPPHAPASPRFQQWWLTSAALAAASVAVAERTRTSSSAVMLTLAATALAALRGQSTVPMLLITGNRVTERQQRYMAATAQDGLYVHDGTAAATLDDAVRAVYRRSAATYLRAAFHPASLEALTAEIDAARTHPLDLTGYFNDARLSRDWQLPPAPGPYPRSARGPAFVRGYDSNDMAFCLALAQQGPDCQVSLLADTRLLPAPAIPAVLSGLEAVLCEAAASDVPLSAVPPALGLV